MTPLQVCRPLRTEQPTYASPALGTPSSEHQQFTRAFTFASAQGHEHKSQIDLNEVDCSATLGLRKDLRLNPLGFGSSPV